MPEGERLLAAWSGHIMPDRHVREMALGCPLVDPTSGALSHVLPSAVTNGESEDSNSSIAMG